MTRKPWQALCLLGFFTAAVVGFPGRGKTRDVPPVVFSQAIRVDESTVQIDIGEGPLELPRNEVVQRIRTAADHVARFYGRFPVSRVRILVVPVSGRHGVLQGTTWGDKSGLPAFVRIRLGSSTSSQELTDDWIITHELVHTALSSLPDQQHWLEEGVASYIEPIVRAQAGEMSPESMWAGMVRGMPNGEPEPDDRGLNNTHTWGRTYWGGALFCMMADVQIHRETQNRAGLQTALRAIVAGGDTIDTEEPVQRVLETGDRATGTHVLEEMYAQWSESPVIVDLPKLWEQLGIRNTPATVTLNAAADLAATRIDITGSANAIPFKQNAIPGLGSKKKY